MLGALCPGAIMSGCMNEQLSGPEDIAGGSKKVTK